MNLAEQHDKRQAAAAKVAAYEAEMLELHGLKPCKATVCPRVVAGRRCVAWGRSYDHPRGCLCQQHQHLLDHGRMWRNKVGQYVLTGEPYRHVTEAQINSLRCDLISLGAKVTRHEHSPYNPGGTILLMVHR